jgi:polyphosphate kinase
MNEQSYKRELIFFNRDLSWLSFNERVLSEASRKTVPLMERIRFLAIYSSNLDEFYRVRIPTLTALAKIPDDVQAPSSETILTKINDVVVKQLERFGEILVNQILPELRTYNIHLIYNEPVPDIIRDELRNYFIHSVASFIQLNNLTKGEDFFPENNKIYLAVQTQEVHKPNPGYIVNIPSDVIPRFFSLIHREKQYIVFLDDIVKLNLPVLFPGQAIVSHSFKITRNAELDLEDEFAGNLAKKIEKKISQRDFGLATRFLYEPGLPHDAVLLLKKKLNLKGASFIQGGTYHNLKDLSSLQLSDRKFYYEPWPKVSLFLNLNTSLFSELKKRDVLLHPPYHSFETVLRFFNEAAIDVSVQTIYVTLYRVASDSRIVSALISAAKNGKRVIVFVELKARFDEANNIKWSKKMKAAGVKIIESIPGLKVHAKLALVKRRAEKKAELFGLLSTGNFNEGTALYYTDHILMTSDKTMLTEAAYLFSVLRRRKKKINQASHHFRNLLVGHFNLQERFIALIEREIKNSQVGKPASITIKFNNLEDQVLISKLYEASSAGVKISLIVRGICCLKPGIAGISQNITVIRIIDRFLEHGRIFIFQNDDDPEVYLGSADWMNRNIYRRIEVCFPIRDPDLKRQLIDIVNIQLNDNLQAVTLNDQCKNIAITTADPDTSVRSQHAISKFLQESQYGEGVSLTIK